MLKKTMILLSLIWLCGCTRYERIEVPEIRGEQLEKATEEMNEEWKTGAEMEPEIITITQKETEKMERIPVRVKGVYVSAYVAGSESMMDPIIEKIDQTEINAVVIDVKDDEGRVTFSMDSPMVTELGAVDVKIPDMPALMKKLKEHNIYTIARVVAFRDPYLAEKRPDLSLKLGDGSIYRDSKDLAWVNPYKQEVWDYLVEVGLEAHEMGFDEIQFDYIRFSTEKGIDQVVYDEADTNGRSKKDIITEFIGYAYEKLAENGVFVAADVFGAIMGGGEDSDTVGQSYGEMAKRLDYICPMVYPSHYGDGNFGIEHPDTQPYDTILGAMNQSREDLGNYETEDTDLAIVRPWLQDFTASYLEHYIPYGDEEVRAQIQAVYDAGYEEWILWSASCKYHWGGLEPETAEAGAGAEIVETSESGQRTE